MSLLLLHCNIFLILCLYLPSLSLHISSLSRSLSLFLFQFNYILFVLPLFLSRLTVLHAFSFSQFLSFSHALFLSCSHALDLFLSRALSLSLSHYLLNSVEKLSLPSSSISPSLYPQSVSLSISVNFLSMLFNLWSLLIKCVVQVFAD